MIIHLGFEIGVNKPITVNCLFLFAGATRHLGKGHLQPKGESPISRGQGYSVIECVICKLLNLDCKLDSFHLDSNHAKF